MITASKSQIVRVLCVEDNALVAEALAARLAIEPWLRIVDVLGRADALVDAAIATQADIVLLDLDMPGMDAFEAVADLVVFRPQSRCIILTGLARTDLIDRAVAAGAWGYVAKTAGAAAILEAIRTVLKGRFSISPDLRGLSQTPQCFPQ